MRKERRVYKPRLVGGKVMMPSDLRQLHKYMLEIEHIDHISDEMRAVVESGEHVEIVVVPLTRGAAGRSPRRDRNRTAIAFREENSRRSFHGSGGDDARGLRDKPSHV